MGFMNFLCRIGIHSWESEERERGNANPVVGPYSDRYHDYADRGTERVEYTIRKKCGICGTLRTYTESRDESISW